MDKVKEGLKDLTNAPQRGAEEAGNKGQQTTDAAKEKTQNRPGDNLKNTVDDKANDIRSEGERLMGSGGLNK